MTIRQRNKGWQIDISYNRDRYRINVLGSRKFAAATEKELISCLDIGMTWNDACTSLNLYEKDTTIKMLFDGVADTYNSSNAYTKALQVVNDIGINLKVSKLDEDYIKFLISKWIKNGNKNSTINRKQAVLSKLLSYAKKKGYIKNKPEITWRNEGTGRIRYMHEHEEDEMCSILKSVGHDDMVDLIKVACDTGFRLSELKNINTSRDLHDGNLTCVATKNDTIRTIPLTKRSLEILKRRDNFPFANITDETKRSAWDYAKMRMGLQNDSEFTFHCTRHTCASRLVQRGIGIQVVQHWLGHKTIKMTLRYAHLNNDNLKQARNVLEMKPGDKNGDKKLYSV